MILMAAQRYYHCKRFHRHTIHDWLTTSRSLEQSPFKCVHTWKERERGRASAAHTSSLQSHRVRVSCVAILPDDIFKTEYIFGRIQNLTDGYIKAGFLEPLERVCAILTRRFWWFAPWTAATICRCRFHRSLAACALRVRASAISQHLTVFVCFCLASTSSS